ncbi:hypothetical protein [Arthrobacter sp. NPDC089319]|uniref:hypothetical protein n=1 Tax=Arthrobacter sp. NPDC089319 TaxID=3155915 RepID=UPI00341857B1
MANDDLFATATVTTLVIRVWHEANNDGFRARMITTSRRGKNSVIVATSEPGRVLSVAAEWLSGLQPEATAAAIPGHSLTSDSVRK